MKKLALMTLILAVVLTAAQALAGAPKKIEDPPAVEYGPMVVPAEPIYVDPWQLLQSDGGELFEQMCASCHGKAGAGSGVAARSLSKYPPPLTTLEAAGVPRDHWVYVIESPCDDSHHWGPHQTMTMPCWRRVFREALGNDAAPLLVSVKLVSYLDTIQE